MSEFPYKIDFEISKDADDLLDCLNLENINRDRSTIEIKKENKKLFIEINAKDPTALRASFDGLIKLIITYEKMKTEVK